MSNNLISGTIPAGSYRDMSEMKHLSLHSNLLSGSIPEEGGRYYKKIEKLQTFDASNNRLIGEVPLGFTDCNYLSVLCARSLARFEFAAIPPLKG